MVKIEELTRIHDRFQLEFKFSYALAERDSCPKYEVETYLFIPSSLGINRHTYPTETFYSDIQNYIRLRTPSMMLADIIAETGSPLSRLNQSVTKLTSGSESRAASQEYGRQLRLFCSIVKSAIRDKVEFIRQQEAPQDLQELVGRYLCHTRQIADAFRNLRGQVNVPVVGHEDVALCLLADEYLSLLLDKYTYKLLDFLKECPDFPEKGSYEQELHRDLLYELKYREENNYPSIPKQNGSNEVILFRISALKKLMGSVLFLHTRTDREGKLAEHLVFGIAAGLAMAFATGVAFYSRTLFRDFTIPLFLVLVLAYVFKDRIKDIGRMYFGAFLRKWLYDRKTDIFSNLNTRIGVCRESARFVREKSLPENIRKLRERDLITELDNGIGGEKVLVYRKHIRLYAKHFKNILENARVHAINDILRLNIENFLKRMDDPKKQLYRPDENGYHRVNGRRVYHLNTIIRYTMGKRTVYHRFRVILNRKGLIRVEDLNV